MEQNHIKVGPMVSRNKGKNDLDQDALARLADELAEDI